MPVYVGSRYAASRLITVTDTRDGAASERDFIYDYTPLPPGGEVQEIHTVQAGERLDMLAYKYAGDSTLWWVIADVNDIHTFPLFLKAGTKLKIPANTVFEQARSGVR